MEQVDIPGLTRVGGAVTTLAGSFRSAWTDHSAQLMVGSDLDGWATGPVLDRAGDAWQRFTGELADQVRAYGEGLTASARDLQAADQAAADRVRNAGPR